LFNEAMLWRTNFEEENRHTSKAIKEFETVFIDCLSQEDKLASLFRPLFHLISMILENGFSIWG
jgi:hypothetical protein